MSKNQVKIGIVGYSSTKFDVLKAKEILEKALYIPEVLRPHIEIVSGWTNLGVPALAYEIAASQGIRTKGIACSKAKEHECFPVNTVV